jgi:hypothetical protein
MDQEYLNLFKNVNNDKSLGKPLKEKNYNNLPSLNETPDVSQYQINENLTDGWDIQFETETRIDGVVQNNNPHVQQRTRRKNLNEDLNGLNKYMDDEHLHKPVNSVNEVVNLKDTDVVSLAMFESMRKNAMMSLANRLR